MEYDGADSEQHPLVGPAGVIGDGARRQIDQEPGRSGVAGGTRRPAGMHDRRVATPEVGGARSSVEAG